MRKKTLTKGLAGNLIPRTSSFKYLGSTKQATAGCEVDVDNVIISAWNYSGGMCEKKVTGRLDTKLYKTVIRPIANVRHYNEQTANR